MAKETTITDLSFRIGGNKLFFQVLRNQTKIQNILNFVWFLKTWIYCIKQIIKKNKPNMIVKLVKFDATGNTLVAFSKLDLSSTRFYKTVHRRRLNFNQQLSSNKRSSSLLKDQNKGNNSFEGLIVKSGNGPFGNLGMRQAKIQLHSVAIGQI